MERQISLGSWQPRSRSTSLTRCGSPLVMRKAVAVALLVMLAAGRVSAQNQAASIIKSLSLEELMQIDVVTVTRTPEPVGTAAAAISLITREDIRRSGVTTIADALALADGVHVARFNNGTWDVT